MNIPLRVPDHKKYMAVSEDTVVDWTYDGDIYQRTIPEGYEFRPGAGTATLAALSIAGYPYALLHASLIHDYLYDEIEKRPEEAVPRVVADASMKADDNDPEWIREFAFKVVRLVGWIPWLAD